MRYTDRLFDHYLRVREFMERAGQDTPAPGAVIDRKVINLRKTLIHEEVSETILAETLLELVDGLADTSVVSMGTVIAMGVTDDSVKHVMMVACHMGSYVDTVEDLLLVKDGVIGPLVNGGDLEPEGLPSRSATGSVVSFNSVNLVLSSWNILEGLGLDPAVVVGEVDRSNLRKFGPEGYRREDGKWMKPPEWVPPDLGRIIRDAGLDPDEVLPIRYLS